MSYARIISRVQNEKWAIMPDRLAALYGVLLSRDAGHALPALAPSGVPRGLKVSRYAAGAIVPDAADGSAVQPASAAPGVAVIFASGVLGKHLSAMEEDCAGGLSVDKLQAALSAAAADPAIGTIVLHLDTPGGVVTGIPETRDLVRRISSSKTIVAYCDSLCASAGYWIASACDYIYATRSADLGSIGVYSALLDLTVHYAQEGVKVELFKQGAYKAAGFPGTSLTDEQRAEIQSGVDDLASQFKADVRESRPQVEASAMEGQCLMGISAVKAGLADVIVADLAEVLADLARVPVL